MSRGRQDEQGQQGEQGQAGSGEWTREYELTREGEQTREYEQMGLVEGSACRRGESEQTREGSEKREGMRGASHSFPPFIHFPRGRHPGVYVHPISVRCAICNNLSAHQLSPLKAKIVDGSTRSIAVSEKRVGPQFCCFPVVHCNLHPPAHVRGLER